MSLISHPFSLVHISTWPCELPFTAHISIVPLPIVDLPPVQILMLTIISDNLSDDVSLEQSFAMVLSIHPISLVPPIALVKYQVSKLAGPSILEIAQVHLLQFLVFVIIEGGYETNTIGLVIF